MLGAPDDVIEQIRQFEARTQVERFGVVMLGESARELLQDMFAREVMPAFDREKRAEIALLGR